MMNCQVAILAGGMGTRLKSRTGDLPKPMAQILGRPVLEHQIALCQQHGFTKIALLVHYQSEYIQDFFGDGTKFGVELTYVVEKEARGTAGALLDALDVMDRRFLVLYGDTYADINLSDFWRADNPQFSVGTLLLHPNDHPHDSDLVEVDDNLNVVGIRPYPHPEGAEYANLVNAAMYILDRDILREVIPESGKFDLAKHTFVNILERNLKLRAYVTPEYIKDMGTPARLDKVERDITFGLPERLSTRQPRIAVFLDRDGTLNQEVNHLNSPSQLELIDGVCDAIHLLNRSGLLAIGVTNQPVVARGDVTWSGLRAIHARLDHLLGEGKAYLDRLYICPHHPDKGFVGEVPELKMVCDCRKPSTGLIDRAVVELNIARRDSWMVGDTTSDILAGKRAGLRTALVRTGYAGRDFKYNVEADFVGDSLIDVVDWILHGRAFALKALLPSLASVISSRLVSVSGLSRSGKTTAAKLLADQLREFGKSAHVISLDNWLIDPKLRKEGGGVLTRYDLDEALRNIESLVAAKERINFSLTPYDRKTQTKSNPINYSIGPNDVIIVEGVPALLDHRLRELSDVAIFLDVSDSLQKERVFKEYVWRGYEATEIEKKISSREIDEVEPVKLSRSLADYQIKLQKDENDSK